MSFLGGIFGKEGDWTIEVPMHGDLIDSPKKIYRVNEDILGKASKIITAHRVVGHSRTCRLYLSADAALAFPMFLAYLSSGTLELNTENACVMHHLGEYLEVPLLCATVEEFCKDDLTMENAEVYYAKATMFGSENLLVILAKYFARNILQISEDSWVVTDTDLQLWFKIMEPDRIVNSDHLSKLVAVVCTVHHQLPLGAASFYELTDAARLPLIDPDAAAPLAAFNEAFLQNGEAQNIEGHLYESLKNRCIRALSTDWKHWEERFEEMGAYRILTDDFQLEVFKASLARGMAESEQATEQLEWLENDVMAEWKRNRVLADKLGEAEHANRILFGKLAQTMGEKQKLARKHTWANLTLVVTFLVSVGTLVVVQRRNK